MKTRSKLLNWARRAFRRAATDDSYVDYLNEVAADSSIQMLRARSLAQLSLARGHHVIDIGCGPGTLTVQLGHIVGESGRVAGVDCDGRMVRAANQSAANAQVSAYVTHSVDDCTALSFGDEVFDACYCERVFQHLSGRGPARAAAEMLRVLKPGGRFVLVDTDWSTLAINADRADLKRRVVAAVSKAFPNPKAGQRLRAHAIEAGAIDVRVEVSAFDIGPSGATATLLTKTAARALSADELAEWLASLEGARLLQLPYARLTMTIVAGVKPSGAI